MPKRKYITVKGLNEKEEKLFNFFLDGKPHSLSECEKIFEDDAVYYCQASLKDNQWDGKTASTYANSWVRNSLRHLRDAEGWVQKKKRGVYQLSNKGKKAVKLKKTSMKKLASHGVIEKVN